MEHGQGSIRRNAKLGAFVASLMLAVMLPTMAFAAVASFSSKAPVAGSNITATKPTISTVVYDRYGVSTGKYSITLDGVKRTTKITRISGLTRFKLSYAVTSALSIGTHTVTVAVRDRRGYLSKKTWTFNVVDGTPPVTTSDAGLNYTGLAVITLSATDNDAVEETHYILDGGAELTYSGPIEVTSASALQPWHTLEFWSEDESDNEEAHHTVGFNVAVPWGDSHAMPTAEAASLCVTTACHGTDFDTDMPANLASIHKEFTCAPCHAKGQTPISNCTACHGPNGPHGETHIAIPSVSTDPAPCTASSCHGTNAMTIHDSCFQCHTSESQIVIDAIQAGMAEDPTLATCESCHPDGFPTIHADGNAPHAVPTSNTCSTPVCHTSANAISIHEDAENGCATCHNSDIDLDETPLSSCVWSDCHPDGLGEHDILPAAHITENSCGTGNAAACHPENVATIHVTRPVGSDVEIPGCAACHAVDVEPSTDCAECHTNPHVEIPAHISSIDPGCFQSGNCHADGNVVTMHTTWVRNPGCAACHESEVDASTTCVDCHPSTVHGPIQDANHASPLVEACADCHLQNLEDEHAAYGIGCLSCHASSDERVKAAFEAGETACYACHYGTGSNANLRPGHGSDFTLPTNASQHNVTGASVGMKSKFDGSQGPLLQWVSHIASSSLQPTWVVEAGFQPATRPDGITSVTVGQVGTVTTDWEIPTVNVFWDSEDAAAPADGMTGLNSNSEIGCTDCHDAEAGIQATGPHGSTQTWAIDPDYPLDYSYAELTKQVVATDGVTPLYPSGIKMRSTLTTATQTYTSGMGMICSKCHDLQNYQSGTTLRSPLPLISGGYYATFEFEGDTFTPTGSGTSWYVYTDENGNPATSVNGQRWQVAATGTVNTAAIGSSNTAHSSHHQDTNDGSAQCVNCHIGVPHGWKRPRLLVNGGWGGGANAIDAGVIAGDPAPYLHPNALGTSRTNGSIAMGSNGYNKMSMLTLSAVDNHLLTAGSTYPGPSSRPTMGMIYNTGAAYWSEASCQACNDHAGEDGIRIIDSAVAPEE